MAQAGIYRITVKRAGKPEKYYIGQTSNLRTRKVRHVWELRKGCHRNPALQAAFAVHGESAFKFDILEECVTDKKILSEREKFYIDTHHGQLYNVNIEQVTTSLGTKRTLETRRKMSISQKAAVLTDARKAVLDSMRAGNVGRKLSADTIAKRSAKQRGLKRSPETRRKMSESAFNRKSVRMGA